MKKNLTKSGLLLAVVALSLTVVSCKREGCTDAMATNYDAKAKKDNNTCEYNLNTNGDQQVEVTGNITSDTKWTANNIYVLNGKVVVTNGATLTIEAGTIVKGKEGVGTNASALIIARGAKINAIGTKDSPVIFTSILDNIKIGEKTGSNMDETASGKWGGLIVLGNAPISASNGDVVSQIEGIPASETYGAFGGNNAADNSGVLSFISLRHSGALIGAGNEINGLTLGGVGSGTTVNNVEIFGSLDDGIEFFGGTVNVTNIVVSYVGDDGIDIDQNYAGTVNNYIVVQNQNSDKALEVDGPENTTYNTGKFTLMNGTVYSKDGASRSGDFKDKAQGTVDNLKINGFTNGNIKVRASYQNDCNDVKTDACSNLIMASNAKLVFANSEIPGVEVYTTSVNSSTAACPVKSNDQSSAASKVVSATATGASQTVFNWTYTALKNKF